MSRTLGTVLLAALASVGACAPPSSPVDAPARPTVSGPSGAPVAAAESPAADGPIVFVENDYERALAMARSRHVPLFIDAWAPWCHTCLSLRSYVFPDPVLRRLSSRFVWLSVDTEREESAKLVQRLDVRVLPTLYVVDSATDKPVLAWPGSLTAPELVDLLEDAATAVERGGSGTDAAAALLRGRQATAAGDRSAAITAYREALAAAPPGWSRRAQGVDALVTALAESNDHARCATTAADEARSLPPGTALADVLRAGIECAEDLPPAAPERGRLQELATLGERTADDRAQPILADDRSDLYDYVVSALAELKRKDDAARVARSWSAFLDEQAARAPTPEARAVFDSHRLSAYLKLGQPERAVAMLLQSQRDSPQDYNPPARLGTAYIAMKRYDDALASLERALGLAYGPRKLRIWALEADAFQAKGDADGARRALAGALAFASTAPLSPGYAKLRDALAARLAALR